MAEVNQFGSTAPAGSYGRGCLPFESMLADSMDGTLSPEDQARFDAHLSTCASCSEMLAGASRGAAWLDLLRPFPPEPPADLVSRILQQTSVQSAIDAEAARRAQQAFRDSNALLGTVGTPLPLAPAPPATVGSGRVLAFPARAVAHLRPALGSLLQTRFAMTAAMAFFSVALTLNLTGVQVSRLHARDLRPGNVKRSFYEANARVVRYYESFRVVYELESRVRDLQHTPDDDNTATPLVDSQSSPSQSSPSQSPPAQSAPSQPAQSAPAGSQASPSPASAAPHSSSPRSSNPPAGDRTTTGTHGAGQSESHAGSTATSHPGPAAADPRHSKPASRGFGSVSPVLAVSWPQHASRSVIGREKKGVLA